MRCSDMMYPHTELTKDYLDSIEVGTVVTNKKKTYLNIECAFDIETTSTVVNGEKIAFPYIWMFGLGMGNKVFYGRTWDEFQDTMEVLQEYYELNENKNLVCYVHNLGYEFQFMRKYMEWSQVFAIDERKPVKALNSYGIEFRDSYILSGYSLENTAKNLATHKVKKLVGDLDYSLVRTIHTELSETEMAYCENDIEVVLAYINEQISVCGDINRIPMTNTGRVRKYVQQNCYYTDKNHKKSSLGKYCKYRTLMGDLTLTPPIYLQLKRSFMGGFTHSNPTHTGKLLENVGSIDLTSSYPSVMLAEQYPMSRARELKITSIKELKEAMKKYCIVFDIKLEGVDNKIKYESYLSESKCRNLTGAVINNGRVYCADSLEITITDVDFSIIEQVYSWEKISIRNVQGFAKAYLPKQIVESILDLYVDKTELKGVEGKEVEYLLSKGMLNSVYGMCVTDIVKDDSVYETDWGVKAVNMDDKISEYNTSKNRFLYYAWGIWVTAYARKNLWSGILAFGNDYVYSDTDSIKAINYDSHKGYVEAYNNRVGQKLEAMCKHYKLDTKRLTPKTIKGVPKPLGVWEFEGNYDRFKTLGAKRYLVQEGDKYTLTVAGLSKANGMEYMIDACDNDSDKIFDMFNDDLYIPANRTGKMTHTYLDLEMEAMITDYKGHTSRVVNKSGIHLEECDFTLSVSSQYNDFLRKLADGFVFKGGKFV